MSRLVQNFNNRTMTENGAVTLRSSLSPLCDLFFSIGARRGGSVAREFSAALNEDERTTTRILLWARDIRGGAGERQHFRTLIVDALNSLTWDEARRVIAKIPEVGRFDDLAVFQGTPYESVASNIWVEAIRAGNGLAAKWAPRKDKKGAKWLRKEAGLNERDWRKFVVRNTTVVEQDMCADKWFNINYSHVPSLAMKKYHKAFHRHDDSRFNDYIGKLSTGEEKVNAGAVYPYQIMESVNSADAALFEAQWKALPDYMEGTDHSILPVVDVSGSMGYLGTCPYSFHREGPQPINVAVSLGLYISQRNNGTFKDVVCTFSEKPSLVTLKGSLHSKIEKIKDMDWGMNTNINAVFEKILGVATREKLDQSDLPATVLIISDMEFDYCGGKRTNFEKIDRMFEKAGYERPQLVFWNVANRGSIPVRFDQQGTGLVSGFSPSIMKAILKGSVNPEGIMRDAVDIERYQF